MLTPRLTTQSLLLVAAALVMPIVAIDVYLTLALGQDNPYLYLLAVPAAVVSYVLVQIALIIAFVTAGRFTTGKTGAVLVLGWALAVAFLLVRFFYSH